MVFFVKFFLAWLIPDVPVDIKARITRERYLIQEYLNSYELGKITMQLNASLSTEPPPEGPQDGEEGEAAHRREFTGPRGREDEEIEEQEEEDTEEEDDEEEDDEEEDDNDDDAAADDDSLSTCLFIAISICLFVRHTDNDIGQLVDNI